MIVGSLPLAALVPVAPVLLIAVGVATTLGAGSLDSPTELNTVPVTRTEERPPVDEATPEERPPLVEPDAIYDRKKLAQNLEFGRKH